MLTVAIEFVVVFVAVALPLTYYKNLWTSSQWRELECLRQRETEAMDIMQALTTKEADPYGTFRLGPELRTMVDNFQAQHQAPSAHSLNR